MNTFPCASCREPIQAADDLVGKSILCPHCRFATTVASAAITTAGALPTYPSSTSVTTTEVVEAAEQTRRRRDADERDAPTPSVVKSGAWMPSLVTILVVVAVLSILVALLVPAVEKVREAAARTQSVNNLKQIALASHSFHDTTKRLPFNGSDLPFKDTPYQAEAGSSNPHSGSWAFQILPFVEAGPTYNGGGQVNAPIPAHLRNAAIPAYLCPGRGRPPFDVNGGAWTDYFYNNYLNDPMQASNPNCANMRRTLVGIADGTSNTVLFGHGNINTDQYQSSANVTLSSNIFRGGTNGTMRSGNDGEKAPGGTTLHRDSNALPMTVGNWGGPFPQGALMGMADGCVRMFPYEMQIFRNFLTPTGDENVILPDT